MNQSRIKLNLTDGDINLIEDLIRIGYTNTHLIDFYIETTTIDARIRDRYLVLNNPSMFTDKRIKRILLEYLI